MLGKEEKIIKEWENVELHVRNIIEGERIERFKFTKGEKTALEFALNVLSANRQELNEEEDIE